MTATNQISESRSPKLRGLHFNNIPKPTPPDRDLGPVHCYLDVSTWHITAADDQQLIRMASAGHMIMIASYTYGYILWVPDKGTAEGVISRESYDLSPSFYELLDYAAECKCNLLRIDRDGVEIDELTKHDW